PERRRGVGRGQAAPGGLRPRGRRAGAARRRAGRLALGVPRRRRQADRPPRPRRAAGRMDSGAAPVIHEVPLVEATVHGYFSTLLAPVVTVEPGDSVRFSALNAGWRWAPDREHFERD